MKIRAAPVMYASREGNGNRTPSTAYPNQGVDLGRANNYLYAPPGTFGLEFLGHRSRIIGRSRSLNVRYAGKVTPFGTSVASVIRADNLGMAATQCGYCGQSYRRGLCGCHNGATPNVSDTSYVPLTQRNGGEI